MINAVLDTFEDFERIAEDYFFLIPPDTDSFLLDICNDWKFDEFENTLTFYFDSLWDLETFNDKMIECPKFGESFDYFDVLDSVDRKNLKIVIQGKMKGLY